MAQLQMPAVLIHERVDAALHEYAGAAVPGLAVTSEALDNAAVLAAARVLASACAQLCAPVFPPWQTMHNSALDLQMITPACVGIVLNARVAEHRRDCPNPVSNIASLPGVEASTTQDDSAVSRAHRMSCFPDSVVQEYPWKEMPQGATVCVVGDGGGHVAMALLLAEPQLRAVVQDAPRIIERAEEIWQREAPTVTAEKRVIFVPLDVLAASPVEDCEIYYLPSIWHDMSEETLVRILGNIKKSMTEPDARVLVHVVVVPNSAVASRDQCDIDLLMMVYNGQRHTLADFIALGETAGLMFEKLWGDGEMRIIEFWARLYSGL